MGPSWSFTTFSSSADTSFPILVADFHMENKSIRVHLCMSVLP